MLMHVKTGFKPNDSPEEIKSGDNDYWKKKLGMDGH